MKKRQQDRKEIMKLGRKWAKRTFNLTEKDFIDLEITQTAYLAGYNRCMRDLAKEQITNNKLTTTGYEHNHEQMV